MRLGASQVSVEGTTIKLQKLTLKYVIIDEIVGGKCPPYFVYGSAPAYRRKQRIKEICCVTWPVQKIGEEAGKGPKDEVVGNSSGTAHVKDPLGHEGMTVEIESALEGRSQFVSFKDDRDHDVVNISQ
ncbi:hypothetical protein Tco_0689619 [Tanacetum coccineum]